MRYIGLGCLILGLGVTPAKATITLVEPNENDRKLHEFSFDTNKSFLSKRATDTVSYIVEATEHDPTYPYFQIINLSSDKTEKPVVEFLKDNETVKVTSFQTTASQAKFKITIAFNALDISTDPAIQLSRKRVDLELGFHSGDQAKDAKDKATVSFYYDHTVPASEPKSETISGGDQAFQVEVKDIPTDVRYLILAYGIESTATETVTALAAQDILGLEYLQRYALCYQAIDISSQQTVGRYAFDGKNTVGSFRCSNGIQNDTPYLAGIAFADTAGNVLFSKNVSHTITPRQLSGVLDETQTNCVSANLRPPSPSEPTRPPRLPIFLSLVMILAFLSWQARRRLHHGIKLSLLMGLTFLSAAPAAQTQELYDASGQLVTQPTYGFVELMYGFFPHPGLSSGIAYNSIFEPGLLNLSNGPSALLMGTQWNWLWTPFIDAGPFVRLGAGIEKGNPFFLVGGTPTASTAETLTLLMFPFQAGGGVNLHLLHRLLSFNGRLGVQYSLFNQTFSARKDAGTWFGNFSSFAELNAKFNLDWLEAWAAWGLFDDWGIQNTYLSAHLFYFTNLTGTQIMISSNTAGNSFIQNLGWFFGFTFEI